MTRSVAPVSRGQIALVLRRLIKRFPTPGAMEIGNPFQTLVAVVLSARTRDEQVLLLLPEFFRAFATPEALAVAPLREIEKRLSTIGMWRQKAKHVKALAQMLLTHFGGQVPETMSELVALPGVGRKTASVVLVSCFKTPAIAVDTHVHRVVNRLGWVRTQTPAKTESALLDLIPQKEQPLVNRVFVKFGRFLCLPGKPRCYLCPVKDLCAFSKKQLSAPANSSDLCLDLARREQVLEDLRQGVVSTLHSYES